MANACGNSEFKSKILRWPFYLMNLLRYTCQNGRERATLRETKEYGTWMWSLGKGQSLIYYWVVFVGSIVVVFGDQQNSILGDNPRSNIPWLYTIVPCKSFPQKKTLHSLYILSSPQFTSFRLLNQAIMAYLGKDATEEWVMIHKPGKIGGSNSHPLPMPLDVPPAGSWEVSAWCHRLKSHWKK